MIYAPINPVGTRQGLLIPDGTSGITLNTDVNLNPQHQYIITVDFRSQSIDGFYVALGTAQPFFVQSANLSTEQTYSTPAQNFTENSTIMGMHDYILQIFRHFISAEHPIPQIIIDYICVDDTIAPPTGTPGQKACSVCTLDFSGLDFLNGGAAIIRWLICVIWNFLTCTLVQLIIGIWTTITHIIGLIVQFVVWLAQGIGGAIGWILNGIGSIIGWLGSAVGNIIGGIGRFFSNILGGLGDLINAALLFAYVLGNLVFTIFVALFNLFVNLVGLIGQLIHALIVGLNSNGTIPIYSTACDTPNTFGYAICQGLYVIDNTALDINSPELFLLYILEGYAAWRVIGWSFNHIGEVLEEGTSL